MLQPLVPTSPRDGGLVISGESYYVHSVMRTPDKKLVLVDSARTDHRTTERPQGWAPVQWMSWQEETKSLAALGWTFNFLVLDDGSESLQGYSRHQRLLPGNGLTGKCGIVMDLAR